MLLSMRCSISEPIKPAIKFFISIIISLIIFSKCNYLKSIIPMRYDEPVLGNTIAIIALLFLMHFSYILLHLFKLSKSRNESIVMVLISLPIIIYVILLFYK
jgi:hypothetical protein